MGNFLNTGTSSEYFPQKARRSLDAAVLHYVVLRDVDLCACRLRGGNIVKLSGRQLAIMRALWEHGEATVAELQVFLAVDPPLAYSTVATVVSRMEQKGLVTHRCEDRVYYYRAAVSEENAGQSLVGEFVERIFGGSPSELVNHLLDIDQVDAKELQRIKILVQQHETRMKKQKGSQS